MSRIPHRRLNLCEIKILCWKLLFIHVSFVRRKIFIIQWKTFSDVDVDYSAFFSSFSTDAQWRFLRSFKRIQYPPLSAILYRKIFDTNQIVKVEEFRSTVMLNTTKTFCRNFRFNRMNLKSKISDFSRENSNFSCVYG